MGCCISKFRPTRHSIIQKSNALVQDKLVISQNAPKTPKITPISSSNNISSSPLSPTTCSVSSFFATNTNSISSSSSSSSSSILSSKDRSFSNEFLWSCVKENPHIIRINSINELHNVVVPKPNFKQTAPDLKQSIAPRLNSSPKRIRANSPNRQKSSFRKELDRVDSFYLTRGLKSPSPSRRFSSGDYIRKTPTKRTPNWTKLNQGNESVISSPRKENLNSSSHRHGNHHPSCLRKINRERCIHRINSRIDEVATVAKDDIDSVSLEEDIDHPLISLDCFIFL